LIIDRDALFSTKFKAILGSSGIEILLTAYRAPNMNAFAERFVRSIKSECLGQMVFVGQGSLDRAISDLVAHYHDERSHQGIGNEIVSGAAPHRLGQVEVSERLGGLLNAMHLGNTDRPGAGERGACYSAPPEGSTTPQPGS
jgi:putative transposase